MRPTTEFVVRVHRFGFGECGSPRGGPVLSCQNDAESEASRYLARVSSNPRSGKA